MIALGSIFTFNQGLPGEEIGRVVEIYNATDASGQPVGIADGFTVTVQEQAGEPVVTSGDDYFQVFIIQSDDNPDKYAVGVWDKFYGLFIQPRSGGRAYFSELPLETTFTVCWVPDTLALQENGVAEGASEGVSFVLDLVAPEEDQLVRQLYRADKFWELVWSEELQTYVAAATTYETFQTNASGHVKRYDPYTASLVDIRFPAGWGAITQQADFTDHNGNRPSAYCNSVWMYRYGQRVEITPGAAATLNHLSGELTVIADVGDYIRVGVLDDAGQIYQIAGGGGEVITGLPLGRVSAVCYRRDNGDWDPEWLPLRQSAVLTEDNPTATITFPSLAFYNSAGDVMAGYVYEYMAEPAAEIDIWVYECEFATWVGIVATTDENGFWTVTIPEEGLGGELCVRDSVWGTVPILGFPCSDVVLGGHAYDSYLPEFRMEQWWCGSQGHPHLPFPREIKVIDNDTSEQVETEESSYGGWITTVAIPKYKYVDTALAFCMYGAQLRSYAIVSGGEVLDADFHLRSQSFEAAPTLAGNFRASGYYPELKFVIGAKIAGDVVGEDFSNRIEFGTDMSEAARVGLEHGAVPTHPIRLQFRGDPDPLDLSELVYGAEVGNECEYCRCSPWLRPGTSNNPRGYCPYCALIFDLITAMDCRTYYNAYPLPNNGDAEVATRAIEIHPSGVRGCLDLANWYRQVNYRETDGYLTQEGPGQPTNAPRWVTQKPILATMNESTFVAGATSASINAAHPEGGTSGIPSAATVLLRPKVQPSSGTVTQNTVTYRATFDSIDAEGGPVSIEAEFTVPAGFTAQEEDIGDFPEFLNLSSLNVVRYEDMAPAEMLLVTAVTNIEVVEGDPTGNVIVIVVDVPAAVNITPPLLYRDRTPFTIAFYYGGAEVWLSRDELGNLHMLYTMAGNLRYRRLGPRETEWGAPVAITETGIDHYPTGAVLDKPRPAGAFSVVASPNVLAAVARGNDIVILASADAGASWEEVGTLAGSRPFMYDDAFTTCLLYYEGGVVKFCRSQGDFSTLVGEAATVTGEADGGPVAGRWLPHTGQHRVAVPYGGEIHIYVSNDGGASWTEESTVEV